MAAIRMETKVENFEKNVGRVEGEVRGLRKDVEFNNIKIIDHMKEYRPGKKTIKN